MLTAEQAVIYAFTGVVDNAVVATPADVIAHPVHDASPSDNAAGYLLLQRSLSILRLLCKALLRVQLKLETDKAAAERCEGLLRLFAEPEMVLGAIPDDLWECAFAHAGDDTWWGWWWWGRDFAHKDAPPQEPARTAAAKRHTTRSGSACAAKGPPPRWFWALYIGTVLFRATVFLRDGDMPFPLHDEDGNVQVTGSPTSNVKRLNGGSPGRADTQYTDAVLRVAASALLRRAAMPMAYAFVRTVVTSPASFLRAANNAVFQALTEQLSALAGEPLNGTIANLVLLGGAAKHGAGDTSGAGTAHRSAVSTTADALQTSMSGIGSDIDPFAARYDDVEAVTETPWPLIPQAAVVHGLFFAAPTHKLCPGAAAAARNTIEKAANRVVDPKVLHAAMDTAGKKWEQRSQSGVPVTDEEDEHLRLLLHVGALTTSEGS